MTSEGERGAVTEQLEKALRAEGCDAKNFHVREAIQLLHIEGEAVKAASGEVDEMASE